MCRCLNARQKKKENANQNPRHLSSERSPRRSNDELSPSQHDPRHQGLPANCHAMRSRYGYVVEGRLAFLIVRFARFPFQTSRSSSRAISRVALIPSRHTTSLLPSYEAGVRQLSTGDAKTAKLEALKAVRSKTGLSISLCRQALAQNSDDVAAALKWLDANEDARAE